MVELLSRRDRVFIIVCIGLVTALAWGYLIHLTPRMSSATEYARAMAAMGMSVDKPLTIGDLFLAFAMWAVMMVGMMAPATAPVLLMFGAAQTKRNGRHAWPAITIFALGYVGIWLVVSGIAAIGQCGLHQAAILSKTITTANPRLGGAIPIVAGAYQLTPLKDCCLSHCQSPLGFLMTNWRNGALGAFQMGSRLGVYCLGCCWALMCVLFAVGVMNLVWVALLTTFVLVEKNGPKSTIAARLGGAALILFGLTTITRGLWH